MLALYNFVIDDVVAAVVVLSHTSTLSTSSSRAVLDVALVNDGAQILVPTS